MEPKPEEAAPESAPNPEKAAAARELVAGILERMGVQAELKDEDRADGIHLQATAKAGGEMLGRPVVESISYLVNKALNREEAGRKWVFFTAAVEGPPPGEVDPATSALAAELVAKAKKLGGTAYVGQLPASLRGLHDALAAQPGVRIRAEGDGVHRRWVIEA